MIHQMADRATKAQVSVMPGGGVNKNNITQLIENQNIVEYHHSAKMRVTSALQSACFAMDYYKVDPNLVRLV
jgi:copper homeostasis protein CutC